MQPTAIHLLVRANSKLNIDFRKRHAASGATPVHLTLRGYCLCMNEDAEGLLAGVTPR
jgi:hypothetical protein